MFDYDEYSYTVKRQECLLAFWYNVIDLQNVDESSGVHSQTL